MIDKERILVVLTGPTGVGKTALSLQLAAHYRCPILNADSRQLYRDLPIGTDAPTLEEQQRVKHYFVGTKDLDEDYNAGQFEREALDIIAGLDGHVPAILSGGSMMYIDAVCHGLDDIPAVPAAVRETVRSLYGQHGLTWLQQQVAQRDPAYWEVVDRQNPQRLMHCLEICMASGKPYSTYRKGTSCTAERPFKVVKVYLERERDELYARINRRVDEMIARGLEAEASAVYARYNGSEKRLPNSLNTVGYKEMFAYLQGKYDLEEAIRLIKQNTRHYAKRQITWFNRDTTIRRLNAHLDYEEQISIIDHWINGVDRL